MAVLDASALLAVAFGEPGQERVQKALSGAIISAVNMSEVVGKLVGRGLQADFGMQLADSLGIEVAAFDRAAATACGEIHAATRRNGLSLADCACLALGRRRNLLVLTADRSWAALRLGVEVELIR